MEDNGGAAPFDGIINNTVRKKRSLPSRRPRPAQGSSPFLTPPLHHFTNFSSDDNDLPAFDTNPARKEFSLSHCISRADSHRGYHDSLRREINHSTQANLMINGKDAAILGERKRMIGGVTRLLHASVTTTNNLEEGSSDDCHYPLDKKADLEGDTWNAVREEESMMGRKKQLEPSGSVRKSKRVFKKRVFDSYDDNDDEIQFLEKLKYKSVSLCNEETASGGRQLKPSGMTSGENSGKEKTAFEKASEGMDYAEELESVPDEKETGNEIKRRESTLTSRQRAIASSAFGKSSSIEFPDGLPPPTTSRRKKENLSEMEQQLKKAEAAQKRKVQVEKAAREAEAEAIRKILGQDSSRKKREDKNKKRLDELAQEKAAYEEKASTSYIRTIMGPSGTTVSFPIDKVPSLFDPKPSGYPPPRENCAGPSCTNPYRYRDSKTKVPLCSLKCYKAVQEQHQTPPPV